MSNIMTKRCHTKHPFPILVIQGISGHNISNRVVYVILIGYYIVNSSGKLHYPKRMLEPPMCCSWIHKIGQRKLVNISESLEWTRVKYLSFIRSKMNEHMNR